MALAIFIVMFVLIVTEAVERHQASLLAALAMILIVFMMCMKSTADVWEILSVRDLFSGRFWYTAKESAENNSGINWATIIFLGGMMIMVESMGRSGIFRYICLALARLVKYKPVRLFIMFMVISAV
ncbi:MAG: citrate transporter, partial [Lachnospiraceae bacterium]|nr:citrate transporter [Lachnospiraceae bacterium]